MRILITNDDGVYSPGIAALAEVAQRFGEARIFAPDVEMSNAGQAMTARRPVSAKHTPIAGCEAYRVDGTPSDCVMLGVALWGNVELVLSGVNIGSNLGNGMWHSGTLAGAKQGMLLGLRGIAFSAPATEKAQPDFAMLEPWIGRVLETLLAMPAHRLVNVNFPEHAPRGMQWTRQSVRNYEAKAVPTRDPEGHAYYWLAVLPSEDAGEGTDRRAVENGFVSLTPLRLDLTDHDALGHAHRAEGWQG